MICGFFVIKLRGNRYQDTLHWLRIKTNLSTPSRCRYTLAGGKKDFIFP